MNVLLYAPTGALQRPDAGQRVKGCPFTLDYEEYF